MLVSEVNKTRICLSSSMGPSCLSSSAVRGGRAAGSFLFDVVSSELISMKIKK